jgi:hypothetical protein
MDNDGDDDAFNAHSLFLVGMAKEGKDPFGIVCNPGVFTFNSGLSMINLTKVKFFSVGDLTWV